MTVGSGPTSPLAAGRVEELRVALAAVRDRLAAACAAAGRASDEVTLVAVSKTHPAHDVRLLAELGVRDFGESRDQEARRKSGELADGPQLRWHFVGRLQRNKCRSIARYADCVHTVDRPELCDELEDGAARTRRLLRCLVQVSLDGDPVRGGMPARDVPALADRISAAAHLELAGVMAVAPQAWDPARAFGELHAVAERVRQQAPAARVISAGMSADLEPAIAAGATHVRVGTALFGHRPPILR